MKVKLFPLGTTGTLTIQDFLDSVIVEKIEETKNFLIVYYVEQKTIYINCDPLTIKEKENLAHYLSKIKMVNAEGVTIDFKF